MGTIWVERQMKKCKNTYKILLPRYKRKFFLHCIVTGNEKWIYFENVKCRKSRVDLCVPLTLTAKPNCFGRKSMLCVLWEQGHGLLLTCSVFCGNRGVVYYTTQQNKFFSLLQGWKYFPYSNSYTLNTELQSDLLWHVRKKKLCTCKGY